MRTNVAIKNTKKQKSIACIYEVGMGIIAVPASCAQQVCDLLVDCGIRVIWNFAPTNLRVPENVVVKNENLAVSLSTLRQQYLKLP